MLAQLEAEQEKGIYLFGESGSGKTTLAVGCFLPKPYYQKAMMTRTYNGYGYEPSVLLD